MGYKHIRPTQKVAWCITVPTGAAKSGNPGIRSSQTFSEGLILSQLWTNRKNRI